MATGGKGGGSGPSKDDLSIVSQMAAMMVQMSVSSKRIADDFENQARASAKMVENMQSVGGGEIVNQLMQVNATLKEVVAALANLNETSTATFAALSQGALNAANSTQVLTNAAKAAGDAAEKETTSLEDLVTELKKTGKNALTGREKMQAFGNYLKKEFPVAAGAALGALSGLKQGFRNIFSLAKGIVGFGFTVGKALFGIAKSIISIPFKLMSKLTDMASSGGGGVSEYAQAINNLRKEFGALNGPVTSAIQSTAASMKGFSVQGLSANQVFGNVAERMEQLIKLFVAGGPALQRFSDEFKNNGGAILGFQKGLGVSDEQMGALANRAISSGTTVTSQLLNMTKQATHLGKEFGVDFKIISKGMAKAVADVKNFGSMSQKQIGAAVTYFAKLGIEVDKVTGVMDAFNTFDEAADKVSTLNQVFGTNIDAMKILDAENPAERISLLQKEFAKAGVAGEKLTRAQRQIIASNIGVEESAIQAAFSSKNQGVSLEKITKESEKAEKKTMTQTEAMSKLADAMDRVLKSGDTGSGGFFDKFLKGFSDGITSTKEFREIMRNISKAMVVVYMEGRRLGKAFVEYFPGIKEFLGGLAEIFQPQKFRMLAGGVVDIFTQFFKDLGQPGGKASFPDLMQKLKDHFFNFFNSEEGAGQKVMGGFKKIMAAIQVILAGGVQWIMESVGRFIQDIVNFIRNPQDVPGVENAKNAAENYVSPIAMAFREGWKILGPALKDLTKLVFEKLIELAKEGLEEHKGKIALAFFGPVILRSLVGAGSAMLAKGIGQMITNAIAGPAVTGAAQAAGTTVTRTLISAVGPGVTQVVSVAETTAAPAAAGLFTRLGSKFSSLAAGFSKAVGPNVLKAFKFAGIAAVIADAAVNISEAMNNFEDKLQKEGFDPATAKIAAGTTGLINTLTFGLLPKDLQATIASGVASMSNFLESSLDKMFGPSLAENMKERLAAQFQIFGGLGDLIMGLWNGDKSRVDKGMKNIGEGLLKSFLYGLEWSFIEFPKLIMQLGVYLIEGFYKLTGWLFHKLGDIFHALEGIPIFGPIFGLIGDFFDKAGEFYEGIAGIFGKLQEFLKKVDIVEWFKGAYDWMKKFFTDGTSSGEGFFGKLFGWFKDIVAVIEEPYRLLRKVFNIIFSWDTKKSFMENMKEKWDAIVSAFNSSADTIEKLFVKILQGPKDAWGWIKENISWENFKKLGEHIVDGLVNGLKALKDKVVDKFKEPIDGIKTFLGIKSPSTVFEDIGGNIIDGLMNKLSTLRDKALQPFTDLKEGIIGLFRGETFFKIFNDVVEGIKSALGKIADFGPFKAVIDIAKKVFETRSPSRVFMKIGDQVVEGFAISMEDLPKEARAQFEKTVGEAQDFAKDMKSVAPQAQAAGVAQAATPQMGATTIPVTGVKNMLDQVAALGDAATKAAEVDKKLADFNSALTPIAEALLETNNKLPYVVGPLREINTLIVGKGKKANVTETTKQFVELLTAISELGDLGSKFKNERIDLKIWSLNAVAGSEGDGLQWHLSRVPHHYGPVVAAASSIQTLFSQTSPAQKITEATRDFTALLKSIDELGAMGVTMKNENIANKIWSLNTAADDLAYHLSRIPHHYGPIATHLKGLSTFISTQLSTAEFTGALNSIKQTGAAVTSGLKTSIEPILKAMTDMANMIVEIDNSVSKTKDINLSATLQKFKTSFGMAMGQKGSHVVQAKDVTINVSFAVMIDATKLEGAILSNSNSKIKEKINLAIGAISEIPAKEVGLENAPALGPFKQAHQKTAPLT